MRIHWRVIALDFDWLQFVSRWFHIVAAIVALGGAAFSRLALVPASRESLDEISRERLHDSIRRRWAVLVHASVAVLLVTGFLNFILLALVPKIPAIPYHAFFGVKLLLALVVFFLASALVSRGSAFASMRQNRARWLVVILVLGAAIILISGVLGQIRAQAPS